MLSLFHNSLTSNYLNNKRLAVEHILEVIISGLFRDLILSNSNEFLNKHIPCDVISIITRFYPGLYVNHSFKPLAYENVIDILLSTSTTIKTSTTFTNSYLLYPQYFADNKHKNEAIPDTFSIKVAMKSETMNYLKTIKVQRDFTTVNDAIVQCLELKSNAVNHKTMVNTAEYALKVVGYHSYLYNCSKLLTEYSAIINIALKNEREKTQTMNDLILIFNPKIGKIVDIEDIKEEDTELSMNENMPLLLSMNENMPALLSMNDCEHNLRIKIHGFQTELDVHYCLTIKCEIWMNDFIVGKISPQLLNYEFSNHPIFKILPPNPVTKWCTFCDSSVSDSNLQLKRIPRESVLCFMIFDDEECKYWFRLPLMDENNCMRRGKQMLNVWLYSTLKKKKSKFQPMKNVDQKYCFRFCGSMINNKDLQNGRLIIEFDSFSDADGADIYIIAPEKKCISVHSKICEIELESKLMEEQKDMNMINEELKKVLNKTILDDISENEKRLIFQNRELLIKDWFALPIFLKCVNWRNNEQVSEAHRYLNIWSFGVPCAERASVILELLHWRFSDTVVRKQAVQWMEERFEEFFQNNQNFTQIYLLSFINCLKFERFNDSLLARFLIKKAVQNPIEIGHYFYWILRVLYICAFLYTIQFEHKQRMKFAMKIKNILGRDITGY